MGICPDRSWQSMKERFEKKIMTNLAKFNVTRSQLIKADEENKAKGVAGKGATEETAPSRRPYSRSDDEAILKHILKNEDYSRVGGRQLWVEMEQLEVVGGRSWQSLKEHFRKVIMRNIRSYRFLTKEQRSSLKARKIVKVNEEDEEKVESMAHADEVEDMEEVEEVGQYDWTLEEACMEGWETKEEEVEEVHVSYILVDF